MGDCPVNKKGNWGWPNAIGLLLPADRTLKKTVPWTYSVSEYQKMVRTAHTLASANYGSRVAATIVGRLDVHSLDDYPPGTVIHYGKSNSFRAHLVISSITDIAAESIVPSTAKAISVCEALKNRQHYKGKFIVIRDRFYGNSLRGSCPPFNTPDYTWESILGLAFPTDSALDQPATWDVDSELFNKLVVQAGNRNSAKSVELQEPVYANTPDTVFATVLGRFETGELEMNGIRAGYGHVAMLPAQLVIVEAKDVSNRQ